MPRALISLALGALLALPVAQAMALGFGRVTHLTSLGQPLSFAVSVRLDADESLGAECVAVEVFAGDNRLPATTLRLTVEAGAEPSERVVRVSSGSLIEEPVVSVAVQITCPPNRLTRKFVAFVDPPEIALAQAAPPLRIVRVEPAQVAGSAAAGRASASQPSAKPATRQPRLPPATKAVSTRNSAGKAVAGVAPASAARRSATPARTARVPAAATTARLKLDPIDDDATRERLSLRLTGSLSPAAAASGAALPAPAPEDAAAQRARERLQALEDSLARLRVESQATQAALAQMQLRLRDAESQRFANPLVLALAGLAAALAAALGFVLWKRRAEHGDAAQWWTPAPQADAHSPADEWAAAASPAAPRARVVDEAPAVETTASPMMLSQVQALARDTPETDAAADGTVPEISVEELIDLEQQAEFFIVLGQDEAAIDLLMGHLRSSGGASPLPYLKLLEIYRRRGDREAGERIRERFNRRFNAYAPDWQADLQQGRTLLDYPAVIASLQSLWATPVRAMSALEASLFRHDGGTSTFDLPAYRELLFLFSVARDLAESETPSNGVDLLLPIGGDTSGPASLTLLRATPPVVVAPAPFTQVDVDITGFDAGPPGDDEHPSRFRTDFSATSGSAALSVEPSVTRH